MPLFLLLSSPWPLPAAGTGLPVVPDRVAGGLHWRIETPAGVLHVWRPIGYKPRTAGIVVYVHGYGTTADDTWRDDRLAYQFEASRRNALFLVPEAPVSPDDDVRWEKLPALLEVAAGGTGAGLPRGALIAIGHSAAYRTLIPWLADPHLQEVILLDALYGYRNVPPFKAWIAGDHAGRRLIIVASETVWRSEQLVRSFRHHVERVGIPENEADFTAQERRARLLYLRSQYSHFEIVSEGKVIAPVLALTSLARIAENP